MFAVGQSTIPKSTNIKKCFLHKNAVDKSNHTSLNELEARKIHSHKKKAVSNFQISYVCSAVCIYPLNYEFVYKLGTKLSVSYLSCWVDLITWSGSKLAQFEISLWRPLKKQFGSLLIASDNYCSAPLLYDTNIHLSLPLNFGQALAQIRH